MHAKEDRTEATRLTEVGERWALSDVHLMRRGEESDHGDTTGRADCRATSLGTIPMS
jgi:hypothetical protein